MDDATIATHFKNLDLRLENVEQILQQGIEPRLGRVERILPTLVTSQYLDERLTAQSSELRQELREGLEQSRRHMDVIAESLRGDLQLIAEHLASIMPKGA